LLDSNNVNQKDLMAMFKLAVCCSLMWGANKLLISIWWFGFLVRLFPSKHQRKCPFHWVSPFSMSQV